MPRKINEEKTKYLEGYRMTDNSGEKQRTLTLHSYVYVSVCMCTTCVQLPIVRSILGCQLSTPGIS